MSEQSDLLTRYAALVREWAPRLDLVAPSDLDRFEDRHIADSLRLLPLLRALDGDAVDVGSGAGLPGVPLAIAEPGRNWTLLEPRTARAAFLEEVVRSLGLSCRVVAATAEQASRSPEHGGAYDFAVARALAPPERAFELMAPLVSDRGVSAVLIGAKAALPPEAEVWTPGIAIVDRRIESDRK